MVEEHRLALAHEMEPEIYAEKVVSIASHQCA